MPAIKMIEEEEATGTVGDIYAQIKDTFGCAWRLSPVPLSSRMTLARIRADADRLSTVLLRGSPDCKSRRVG
jgi:hypothetical protein